MEPAPPPRPAPVLVRTNTNSVRVADSCPTCLVSFASRSDLVEHLGAGACATAVSLQQSGAVLVARRDDDAAQAEEEDAAQDGHHAHFSPTLTLSTAQRRSRILSAVVALLSQRAQPVLLAALLWLSAVLVVAQQLTQLTPVALAAWAVCGVLAVTAVAPLELPVEQWFGTSDDDYDWLRDALEATFFVANVSLRWLHDALWFQQPRASVLLLGLLWLLAVVPTWLLALGSVGAMGAYAFGGVGGGGKGMD